MSEVSPKNLLVTCFDSLGAAYKAVQLAESGVDVLEVFPLGSMGHVMFCSDSSLDMLFKKIQTELKDNIIRIHLLPDSPAKVLRAYLSVENEDIESHLLIVESPYVGDLMSIAGEAVGMDLKVMDLRMLRGASTASYMFLTGNEDSLQKFLRSTNLKTTLIKNANMHIRALFSLQP
jgi:hypothetical protein